MAKSIRTIVPENIQGKSSDLQFSVSAETEVSAIKIFNDAAHRMLDVNSWHKMTGIVSANFTLFDVFKNEVNSSATTGHFIRIDIQGPGPSSGDGYDWVQIEAIERTAGEGGEVETIAMRVRPCHQPGTTSEDIAHFFKEDATSTFLISRNRKKIVSSYHGRNEVLNNNTEKVLDNVRNVVMGSVALAGVSEMQWNALIKGFLKK